MLPLPAASNVTPRYASLDAWRGLAGLLVIGYHSSLVYSSLARAPKEVIDSAADVMIRAAARGDVGVALFFVISGYCIAAAADSTRRGGRTARSYFYRRFRRIYPPLWIVIAGSAVFFAMVDVIIWPQLLSTEPWLQPRPWWYSSWQWVGNLTLTETWRHYLFGDHRAHFPGQAWTLCYEEQFYAVVGVLLVIARRWFFGGVVGVTAATIVSMLAFESSSSVNGVFIDGSWLVFAAGVLVYWALSWARSWRGRLICTTPLIAAALVSPEIPIEGSSLAFLFAALLVWLHPWDKNLSTLTWTRPFTYCGQMCYSLYLVHQLLVKAVSHGAWKSGLQSASETLFVVMPSCFLVSIIVGRTCFLLVERRFLNTPAPASRYEASSS